MAFAEGGWKGLILLFEGRDGRGWSWFARELSKVVDFFEATTVSSSSIGSLSVGVMKGVEFRTEEGVCVPSYAAMLRAAVRHPMAEVSLAMVVADPLGIVRDVDFGANTQLGERPDLGCMPCLFAANFEREPVVFESKCGGKPTGIYSFDALRCPS